MLNNARVREAITNFSMSGHLMGAEFSIASHGKKRSYKNAAAAPERAVKIEMVATARPYRTLPDGAFIACALPPNMLISSSPV